MRSYRSSEIEVGSGKDTAHRPAAISKELLDLKWELAFGRKTEKQKASIRKKIAKLEREQDDIK